MAKQKFPLYSDNQIREIILKYFYVKNKNATSLIGKKNSSAISIKIIRADLKQSNGLSQTQVISNLRYLISQGWIEEKPIGKSFPTSKGAIVPSVTTYYAITAPGIDKIEGPSEFTRDKFSGIKIDATGQNIITLGDGNQINSKFENVGNALSELKDAVKKSDALSEEEKVDVVVDIDSIQNQLAKPTPNKTVIQTLWSGLGRLATVDGVIDLYKNAEAFISGLIS